MTLGSASHQKSGQPERVGIGRGEAQADAACDEARPACQQQESLGRDDLLTQVLSRENIAAAWKRVKANKGSAGIDGLTIEQTTEFLKDHWPRVRREIIVGKYQPQAVRRVEIPKPTGGMRELGIPTVTANYPGIQRVFGMG
jgi:RNA-directed DNA polymerase